MGFWEEKPNQKGLALREHDTPLYEGAGQWVEAGPESWAASGFEDTSPLSE